MAVGSVAGHPILKAVQYEYESPIKIPMNSARGGRLEFYNVFLV
jgi:hypothetical protein